MDKLIQKAKSMQELAHAPFSEYKVGAAVLTKSGEIIGGCNVESSSYGLSCCAERTALYRAVAQGYNQFTALAVVSDNGGSPCGACRQIIWDLCGNIPIHICNSEELVTTFTMDELLPEAFDARKLK